MSEEWPAYPVRPPASGFSADPVVSPALRASNADRSFAAALLDGAYAEGRITADELDQRKAVVAGAITLGDLGPLVSDVNLPTVAEPTSSRLPIPYDGPDPVRPSPPVTGRVTDLSSRDTAEPLVWGFLPRWWVRMTLTLVVIWLVTSLAGGSLQYFWPLWPILGTGLYYVIGRGTRQRHRRRHPR